MVSLYFGKLVQEQTISSFVPLHASRILASPAVDLLAAKARSVKLARITSSINRNIWDFVFYFSVLTCVWRHFPTITPSAIARDARRHKRYIHHLHASLEMQAVAFELQQKTLSENNLAVQRALFEKYTLPHSSSLFKYRYEPARFPGIDGCMYFCSKPSVAKTWVTQAAEIRLSEDPYRRLAESWLLVISLLAIHPFSNGNGRLSRILFNALCGAGQAYPVPLSVFFLLKNGKSLYNELIKRILVGNNVDLERYFQASINYCVAFCRAATHIQNEKALTHSNCRNVGTEDWLNAARIQFTNIFSDRDRSEIAYLSKLEPFVYGGK